MHPLQQPVCTARFVTAASECLVVCCVLLDIFVEYKWMLPAPKFVLTECCSIMTVCLLLL